MTSFAAPPPDAPAVSSAEAPDPSVLEQALRTAKSLATESRTAECHSQLIALEPAGWAAAPALRNRWHRQVWFCLAVMPLPALAPAAVQERTLQLGQWFERWMSCCADESGVDIRYRAWARVNRWVYLQAAGRDMGPEIDAYLKPPVDAILDGPAPLTPPAMPATDERTAHLVNTLLVLGEMGGHLALEPTLLRWREVIARRAGEQHALVLAADRSLAFSLRKRGLAPQALARIESAWKLYEAGGFAWPALRQSLSSELGAVLSLSGQPGRALRQALLTLQIVEQLDGPRGLRPGRAAYNAAGAALALGDFEQARDLAQRSIQALEGGEGADEAEYPRHLGQQARLELGEPGAADEMEHAMRATGAASPWVQLGTLRLLRYADANGQHERIARLLPFLSVHMGINKGVFHPDWVDLLLRGTGPLEPADDAWRRSVEALVQAQAASASLPMARAWTGLARQYERRGAFAQQLWATKQAARVLLPVLGDVPQERQAGFLDVQAELLRSLQQATFVFVQQGRVAEAEWLSAQLQLGEVRHYLRGAGPTVRSASQADRFELPETAIELGWSAEFERLAKALRDERVSLLRDVPDNPGGLSNMPGHADQHRQHQAQLEQLTAQWSSFLAQLATRSGAQGPPSSADVAAPDTSAPSEAVRRRVPAGSAQLWWAVGENALVVRATTRHGVFSATVPVGAAALARLVLQARQAATDDSRADVAPLQALYRVLILPVQAQLQAAGIHDLILQPTGNLLAVPFAALHSETLQRPWLVQRYSLRVDVRRGSAPLRQTDVSGASASFLPSLALLGPLHAFGSASAQGDLPPLPWVREELRWIAQAAGARSSQLRLDRAFTLAALAASLQTATAVSAERTRPTGDKPTRLLTPGHPGVHIHLASHFRLHPTAGVLSYLQLGDGQRADIQALADLPWQHSRLTVASACDTASATAKGDGGTALASLAHALLAAGSPAVVGTIWAVRDESTAHLMHHFYRQLHKQARRASKARAQPLPAARHSALAQSQRSWLQQQAGKPWAHPRHWAGLLWME